MAIRVMNRGLEAQDEVARKLVGDVGGERGLAGGCNSGPARNAEFGSAQGGRRCVAKAGRPDRPATGGGSDRGARAGRTGPAAASTIAAAFVEFPAGVGIADLHPVGWPRRPESGGL